MYNGDFTVLASGGGRHYWVSTCTMWPLHSKWLRQWSSKSASNFVLSNLEHSSAETILMIQRATAVGNWWLAASSHNTPAHALHLMQSFLVKQQTTQVTQPRYSPDLAPCNFWLFPKLKSPLKGKGFQTTYEIQGNTTGPPMVISRCLLWRGLRQHCPVYNVSCVLYLLQRLSLLHSTWLDSFWTGLN